MSQENVWYETLHANFGQYFTVGSRIQSVDLC